MYIYICIYIYIYIYSIIHLSIYLRVYIINEAVSRMSYIRHCTFQSDDAFRRNRRRDTVTFVHQIFDLKTSGEQWRAVRSSEERVHVGIAFVAVRVRACVYACNHMCVFTHVHMYTCTHVHMLTFTHACMLADTTIARTRRKTHSEQAPLHLSNNTGFT